MISVIVAQYLSHNSVPVSHIPAVFDAVRKGYYGLNGSAVTPEPEPIATLPVVPVRNSITPDYIVCLEDGKRLERYLQSTYNMTPDEYRAKWGLPDDYPMVVPNYSAQRSELAKTNGLGTRKDA